MTIKEPLITEEERDVLILTAVHPGGLHLSLDEIGQRLGIPVTRVKTLIHQACVKLGADNRNEAVFLAMWRGEISLNELISLEELAEILSSLDPDILMNIANLVRNNQVPKALPIKDKQIIIPIDRRQAGILANRERDVLILASHGLTNMEIADKLVISTSAVRTFLYRAFKKLGARRKADAIQAALKQREITIWEISTQDELVYFLAPFGAESIEKMAQLLDDKHRKNSDNNRD